MLDSELSKFFKDCSMIMKVSMQIVFQSIMYFLCSFRRKGYGGLCGRNDFDFDTVKEIVILELLERVMNAVQNNEVIDAGNVAEAYRW